MMVMMMMMIMSLCLCDFFSHAVCFNCLTIVIMLLCIKRLYNLMTQITFTTEPCIVCAENCR